MNITVLSDNSPSKSLMCEHGLSVYIEHEGLKFIVDTGASKIYMQNAHELGISLDKLNFCVLSHGHWDHANGLTYLPANTKVIAHSEVHKNRYRKDLSYIGISLDKEECAARFKMQYYDESTQLTDSVFFLTNIMRTKQERGFLLENGDFDELEDDSSVVIKTKKGLVLLSGCAHAGIQNHIIEACRMTGERSVYAILGGLHIKTAQEAHEIGDFLKMHVSGIVYTGHCTSRDALVTLSQYLPVQAIYSGFALEV